MTCSGSWRSNACVCACVALSLRVYGSVPLAARLAAPRCAGASSCMHAPGPRTCRTLHPRRLFGMKTMGGRPKFWLLLAYSECWRENGHPRRSSTALGELMNRMLKAQDHLTNGKGDLVRGARRCRLRACKHHAWRRCGVAADRRVASRGACMRRLLRASQRTRGGVLYAQPCAATRASVSHACCGAAAPRDDPLSSAVLPLIMLPPPRGHALTKRCDRH